MTMGDTIPASEGLDMRVPPNDPAVEAAVLGRIFFRPEETAEAVEAIDPAFFYTPANKTIFEAMCRLFDRGEPIELLSLKRELASCKLLDRVGRDGTERSGTDYLVELAESAPPSDCTYAGELRGLHERRELIRLSGEARESAYDLSRSTEDILSALGSRLHGLEGTARRSRETNAIGDEAKDWLEDAKRQAETGRLSAIETGFSTIDFPTGGMRPGQLILLAARTRGGKSTLALNIALHVAETRGPVLFVAAEMSAREIVEKVIARNSDTDSRKLIEAIRDGETAPRIDAQVSRLAGVPLFVLDRNCSVPEIARAARRMRHAQQSPALIVADYVQMLRPEPGTRNSNRTQQVDSIAQGLKTLAMDMRVPILAPAQLNRDYGKENRPPELRDLRESGGLEQTANTVILLHHDELDSGHRREDHSIVVQIRIAKCRTGRMTSWAMPDRVGRTYLRFRPHVSRFFEEQA